MKFLKILLAGGIAMACILSFGSGIKTGKVKAEEKVIDMYLVAGQSNAAGCTLISNIPADKIKNEYTNGFPNVLYYGKATGSNDVLNFNTPVKLGQGQTSGCIGPELGIADAITELSPDRKAIVVKRAYGGTQLVDTVGSQNSDPGNWTSPSMRNSSSLAGKTGKLYDEYIEVVSAAVSHYKSAGYSINLKGTFWMQGESDVGLGAETYRPYLTALIQDLRADYSKLFGQGEGQTAPFIIGKIASTMDGGASKWPQLTPFREMQEEVAKSIPAVYCVETEDYIIIDPKTNQPAEGCHDAWHFSGKDMLSLGYEAGKLMYSRDVSDMLIVNTVGSGTSDLYFAKLDGSPVSVTFTPDKYYYLSKLTLNGEDITDKAVNGTYVFSGTTGINYLTGEFEKLGQYPLTIETDEERGKLSRDPVLEKYYAGTEIKLTPKPKSGYKLKKLTFNGEELIAVGGVYKIKIVNGENKLIAEWEEASASGGSSNGGNNVETPPTEPQKTEKSSCGSSVGGGAALLAVGIAATVAKRKK